MIWRPKNSRLLFLCTVLWASKYTLAEFFLREDNEISETETKSNIKPSHDGNRTNVVILLADNLAYDDVGIFQNTHGTTRKEKKITHSRTPNLDNAARQGRRFLNWNSPGVLCSASRAALLTGKRYTLQG